MKKLWFICLTLLVFSCGEKIPAEQNQIAGEIVNPTGEPVVITQLLTPRELALGIAPISDTIPVDSTRMAGISKNYSRGYYSLEYGDIKRTLYLLPGKTLAFKIDTKEGKDQPIEYKGNMKLVCRYLQKRDLSIQQLKAESRTYYALDEAPFLHKIDSARKVLDSNFVQFITNKPGFDEAFLKQQALGNQYLMATIAYKYPRLVHYYNANSDFTLSDNFHDLFKDLDLNNPEGLDVPSYTRFLTTMIDEKVNAEYEKNIEKFQNDDRAYFSIGLDIADSTFIDQDIRNYMVYTLMKDIIQYTAPDIAKEHMLYMEVNCLDSTYMKSLSQYIADWESLKAGNPAPQFSYMDIDSNKVSLQDFKGKYVYVDVWATWCGPCKGEIPHLKNLEHKFKDKNIEFVSISLDENVPAWRKMVEDKKLKGTQMFTGGWNTQLSKDYKISSIPRFILIDPEGQIVAARAKRPSSGIDKDLEELLH